MSKKTELQRKEVLRLSNEESNLFTKECIETALLALMKENDFKDISITNIVSRAGVSRSAYYRNYSSKEDILKNYLHTVVQTITNSLDIQKYYHNDLSFWLSIFNRVRPYSAKFLTLLKAGFDGVILSSINKILLDKFSEGQVTSLERYKVFFWNGAFYNLLREWIYSDLKESDQEMAEICQHIIKQFSNSYNSY
ncbi:TetR/AcrR family transcriptional regulator [Amphibacillus sp. Q70]|uniref:TetR/AcrR family transcriptional regulator n=1 Tax=Amphibacillus sp. Q70 TaxID=3453416 RepID=UPI003F878036